MADRLNPAEKTKTAAESDYEKKFNPDLAANAKELKEKEAAADASWKTVTKEKKPADKNSDKGPKKGRFGFVGRKAGSLRNGSAFAFIIGIVLIGVAYTSIFAPNIILVNVKEMYTNDLADATSALNTYYWKLMNYKIGMSQCGDKKDIKCKLSTMSRDQKLAFSKHGFTVIGNKVEEDNRDDGQPGNEKPESRYQVTAIIPPTQSPGLVVTGDMLKLYAEMSSANKALVYSVFNPKSSFFQDVRFKQRIMQKYGLTKSLSVGGDTTADVEKSLDSAIKGGGGTVGIDAGPDRTSGITLGSLSNPTNAVGFNLAAQAIAATSTSYVGLQCAWYSFGKAVTNDAKTAQAATMARFAMQYLQAADQVKIGTSQDITINTMSSNLAQSTGGGYSGPNATDANMYKSIVYGGIAIPSPYDILYSEDTFDLIGALIPAWSQIMATSTAVGKASNVSGSLTMPPANLADSGRNYCIDGETFDNKAPIKEGDRCQTAITASAPPGLESALPPVLELARKTCPHPQYDQEDRTYAGLYTMLPSLKLMEVPLTAYIATLFSANAIIWANAKSLFYSSNTKGVAASEAIFTGTGEILGDMAMSRGMEPANAATMGIYLAQKEKDDKDFDEVARYNAKSKPFDVYNRFSFLGSIVHSLNPSYDSKTPLFSTIANAFSLLGSGAAQLNPNANAFYNIQPEIPLIDPTNPSTIAGHAAGLAQYLTRLHCPDPEYLAIGIMADTACNVRYALGKQEMLASPGNVIDYMEKSHSDLTQDNVNELTQRLAKVDAFEGDKVNIERMLDGPSGVRTAASKPMIDKETGKATPGSEYEKFLDYCVNRRDPWGRSGVAIHWNDLSNDEKLKRTTDKDQSGQAISPNNSGDPYQQTPSLPFPSISEGASQDQDWYSGKKCLDTSDELTNFRAYTLLCSVDGSLSGAADCTDPDNAVGNSYSNSYYTNNDILYLDD